MPSLPSAATPLAAAAGWWLEARCHCGHASYVPCRMLARELLPETTIAEAAARLICRRCRARPNLVELIDKPQHDAPGYVGGGGAKRIPLIST